MRRPARPRLGAIAGIAGPAAFTCGWIVASLRQAGHSVTEVQISGLAAPDARDPGIMIAGFVVLGGCLIAFGGSLHAALGGSGRGGSGRGGSGGDTPGARRAGLGSRLIQAAGVLTIAAGLLRRDHMMLGHPAGESWHNHAHDVVSSVIYVTLVVVPLLLAVRFRGDPPWRPLTVPLAAGSAATAVLLGVFVSGTLGSWDGLLQRVAVTIPLAMLTAVAIRLVTVCPVRLPASGAGSRLGPPRIE